MSYQFRHRLSISRLRITTLQFSVRAIIACGAPTGMITASPARCRIGGKARNKAFGPPPKKEAVLTVVQRDGEARSKHIANVTAKALREAVLSHDSTRPIAAAICSDWGNVIKNWDTRSDPAFPLADFFNWFRLDCTCRGCGREWELTTIDTKW